MALTKLQADVIEGVLGLIWQSPAKTSSFAAVIGNGYYLNTTTGAITVTLPSSPTVGDSIGIIDYAGTAASNIITLTSSNNIQGSSDDKIVNYTRGALRITYADTTQGWVASAAANEGTSALTATLLVDYLVVAGGGGGGGWGGGGGGGGYLTNYLGTAISLSVAVPYTITVGIGGTEGTNPNNNGRIIGTNGGDSILSGTGLTTITATGGGAGGTAFATPSQALPGGSGGGADSTQTIATTGGAGNTPATTPSQGNDGGNSGTTSGNYPGGGGGGGAAAAGGSSTGTPPYTPGNGGDGTSNSITGSAVFYAGGGGGFYYGVGGSRSTGGSGGGGAGGQFDAGAADGGAGTNGLGGGGGSGAAYTGAPYTSASGPGGSGTVILRYPTADVSSFAVTGTLDTVANTAYPVANTAYYKLDGNANDSSGNGYNGTASNITYAAGRFGNAAVFNGSSSGITIPSIKSQLQSGASFTISCWVNVSSSQSGEAMIINTAASSGTQGVNIGIRASTGLVYFQIKGNNNLNASGTTNLVGAGWKNIVLTHTTSSTILYVNGTQEASIGANTIGTIPNDLTLGKWANLSLYYLNGSIDQVRIFNSAISAGNVTSLYNESTVNESTDGTDSILQFIGGSGDITFS
jgi:hypothetical protein